MDKRIINTMIAQDKLNTLCLEFFSIAYPIKNINYIINNDGQFQNYIIDIIMANYLANNYNCNNKNKSRVCNLIFDYATNKDFLHEIFINNEGFSNELISDYYNHYFEGDDINIETIDKEIKNKVLEISPIFDSIAFNFLTDFVRLTLSQMLNHHYGCKIHDDFDNDFILEIVNDSILKRIIVSDAYTYMCYNNEGGEFSNYINIIEENCDDFDIIWDYVCQYEECIRSFIIYFVNLFNEDIEFIEIYKILDKGNSNFLETLKKLNPYYILDYLSDINIKRYRK